MCTFHRSLMRRPLRNLSSSLQMAATEGRVRTGSKLRDGWARELQWGPALLPPPPPLQFAMQYTFVCLREHVSPSLSISLTLVPQASYRRRRRHRRSFKWQPLSSLIMRLHVRSSHTLTHIRTLTHSQTTLCTLPRYLKASHSNISKGFNSCSNSV